MTRYAFVLLLLVCTTSQLKAQPPADYVGLLKLDITYHLFLDNKGPQPVLVNATFKAQPFNLDTIYLTADSLFFRMGDYPAFYHGKVNHSTGHIEGHWTDEDKKRHPLTFVPALADTVSGLHPRIGRYNYQAPPLLNDGLQISAIQQQGIAPEALDSLIAHMMNGTYKDIHSLLIARNNTLVVEEYFYRISRQKPYNIQSATKSVVSALTGIAISRKELAGTQQTLCATVPAYKQWACDAMHKDITLHQLLTMNTGIAWDEQTYDYMDARNSNAIAANHKDQFVYLLTLPRSTSTQPTFAYNSLNHLLVNAMLHKATGTTNKRELTQRLLQPLGITDYYIPDPTPMGVIGDIDLRPRDMLKFGLLYLNDGQWNGRRIVPAAWVHESTQPKIKPAPDLGYGYFWWTKDFAYNGGTVSSYFAWGYGGQYIFVVPSLKLVVVMSGSHWGTDPRDQGVAIMEEILLSL